MESEEVVDNYYGWFTKLNNALTTLGVQDSLIKEVFCTRLRKKLKVWTMGMPRHTFEEVVKSTRQVENDM
jgi:hypothetical protein